MIIAIDGPVASGKTTISKIIAQRCSYFYLCSGLLYRAYAYVSEEACENGAIIGTICVVAGKKIQYCWNVTQGPQILIGGVDCTSQIKSESSGMRASRIGQEYAVRSLMTCWQRALVGDKNAVVDGRDAGTVVFPTADYKFLLVASEVARARRMIGRGDCYSYEHCLQQLQQRDTQDEKQLQELQRKKGYHIIDTSEMTIEAVATYIMRQLSK